MAKESGTKTKRASAKRSTAKRATAKRATAKRASASRAAAAPAQAPEDRDAVAGSAGELGAVERVEVPEPASDERLAEVREQQDPNAAARVTPTTDVVHVANPDLESGRDRA